VNGTIRDIRLAANALAEAFDHYYYTLAGLEWDNLDLVHGGTDNILACA
jgi:hypothetical protein